MKIYIIGSVASGKSTLARRISQITNIPCDHLDEVVYIKDPSQPQGNRKRPIKERETIFNNILSRENYIIEDAGRAYFIDGLKKADTVIFLDIPLFVRQKRILVRFIKQNLGFEKCIYKPNINMLKAMFRWVKDFDLNKDGTKGRIALFKDKTLILCNNKDINKYLNQIKA